METYRTELFGDEYTISGDFAQASSPVLFCGEPTAFQVADFRHWPERAIKWYLESVIEMGGDNPDDFEEEIAEAIDNME